MEIGISNSKQKSASALNVTIQTDVDLLMKLIDQKKEISINEAATVLKISAGTVEAWATFLEEEGVIGIKYKLTTPYLISVVPTQTEIIKKVDDVEEKIELNSGDFDAYQDSEYASRLSFQEKDKGSSTKHKNKSIETIDVPDFFPEISKRMSKLFEKAYTFMEEGKYDLAHKIYMSIKNRHESLPSGLKQVKRELDVKLTKLNKDLSVNIHDVHQKNSKLVSRQIKSKIQKLNYALLRKDIKNAESIYKEIQTIYAKFPDTFAIKKVNLHAQILDSYEKLSRLRKTLLLKYTLIKSKEISVLIETIKKDLKENQLDKAFDTYEKVRQLYNLLPYGYSKERAHLDREIFSLLPELITRKEEKTLKDYNENSKTIKDLIIKTRQHLKKNETAQAANMYNQIKIIYSKLPKAFDKAGIDLEEKLIHLHKDIILETNKNAENNLHEKTIKINKLIKTARNFMDSGNIDLAEGIYLEIIHHYSTLPPGFLEKVTALRVSILHLYRDLLLKSEEPLFKEFDHYTEQRYKQLIKLLVEVRELIDNEDFAVLESKYQAIIQLYGQLPLALVQQKTKIWDEISKLYNEVELYRKIEKIRQYGNSPEKLAELLTQIRSEYLRLASKHSEDIKLFNYIRSRYEYSANQLNLLRKNPQNSDINKRALANNFIRSGEDKLNKGQISDAVNYYERAAKLVSDPKIHAKLKVLKQMNSDKNSQFISKGK